MDKKDKIKNYKDLIVWQKSHLLAMKIYNFFIKAKKTAATYEIWKQCLSASFSVPANIVEGYYGYFGRGFASKLTISKGEAGEAEYWLFVLAEIKEISQEEYSSLSKEYLEVILMINSLKNKIGERTKTPFTLAKRLSLH